MKTFFARALLALSFTAAVSASGFALYADPRLDALLSRADVANADLAAAGARVAQARALAGAARAEAFPEIAVAGNAARIRSMDTSYQASDYAQLPGVASWELDLWGRVRLGRSAARSEAMAADRLLAAARLSVGAEVVQTFYTLQAAVLERGLVAQTVSQRQEARRILQERVEAGTAGRLDLARAESELATTEAEQARLEQQIAPLVNALAVLTGEEGLSFTLTQVPAELVGGSLPEPPAVPYGLPAELALRRPDLAAAQARLDAAGARIGIAKAAFFPTITLTGRAGWESAEFDGFLRSDQRIWSFGPSLYLPLFQGGRNRAELSRTEAAFAEQAALYQGAVRQALAEVRDALAVLAHSATEAAALDRAQAAAQRAAQLARDRYEEGATSFLEVVEADRTAFATARATVRLHGQRLVATARLIRALGGTWSPDSPLPTLARR